MCYFFLQNKSQKSPSVDMPATQIVPSNPPLSEDELEPSKKPRPVRTSSSVRRVSEAANDFEAPCVHAEPQPKTSRKEVLANYFTIPSCEPSGALCQYHRAHMFSYLQFWRRIGSFTYILQAPSKT